MVRGKTKSLFLFKQKTQRKKELKTFSKIILVRVMVFNAIFNNISTMSWRSVLLVEETEVSGESHRPTASQ
jgi:hypothetical protein